MLNPRDEYTLGRLDSLLQQATEDGREPSYFVIDQEDWLSLVSATEANLISDHSALRANTYKGVPVHFNKENNQQIYLVDTVGERAISE